MKKGIEYLEWLSKADQVRFLRNMSTISHYVKSNDGGIAQYLSDEFESFHKFISCAFAWMYSPEGNSYWSKISQKFKKKI